MPDRSATAPPAPDGDCCLVCREQRLDGAPLLTRVAVSMLLCPTCGNKRCPHASDHRQVCTASNAPGQPGSRYPAPPPLDDDW